MNGDSSNSETLQQPAAPLFGGFDTEPAVSLTAKASEDPEAFVPELDEGDEDIPFEDLDDLEGQGQDSLPPDSIPKGEYILDARSRVVVLVDDDSGLNWQESHPLRTFSILRVRHHKGLRKDIVGWDFRERMCVVESKGLVMLVSLDDLVTRNELL